MALLGSLQTGASGIRTHGKSDGCRWQQHRKCEHFWLQKK